MSDLSRATAGSVTAVPSIVSVGLTPAANGARPGSNAKCSADTPAVVARMASPSIAALTRARSQCCAMASTVTQNILLYLSVHVVKRTSFGTGIAALGGKLIQAILNLLPRAGFVRMPGVRTDDVLERQAFIEHRRGHRVGRLLLSVVRARVGDDRHVERV